MTAAQLRKLLDSHGVSQREAARKLGLNERTMRLYVSGDLPVPLVVELALLRVLGEEDRAIDATAKFSATGNTLAFTMTVSRRRQDNHLVLKALDISGKQLFLTTVSDAGVRGHKRLYAALSALLEGRK